MNPVSRFLVFILVSLVAASLARADALHDLGEAMKASFYTYSSSGDVNFDYAQLMREQHRLAAQLSELKLNDLNDATLRRVARSAIQMVGESGESLERWQGRNSQPNAGANAELVENSLASLKDHLRDIEARFIDVAREDEDYYVQLMLWHHELAIALGQMVASQSVDAQMRMLASENTRLHTREVAHLRSWEVYHSP
ncbi:MAG: DUF305 domain-containing protein [Saccharospirillum sp.]